LKAFRISLFFALLFYSEIFPVYAKDPVESIFSSLKDQNLQEMAKLLSRNVNIRLASPEKVSGMFAKHGVLRVFKGIFSKYSTYELKMLYRNEGDGSLFVAYDWTLKKNNDIFRVSIIFTLELKDREYYIINITSVDK